MAADEDDGYSPKIAFLPYRPRSANPDVAAVETELHYFRQQYNQDQQERKKFYTQMRGAFGKIDVIEKKLSHQKSFLAGVGFAASFVGAVIALIFAPVW